MLPLPYIDNCVLDHFEPWIKNIADGVPVLKAMATAAEPHVARQHFLFHTTIDALCFCHLHTKLLDRPGSNVFTVIGLRPTARQLLDLKYQYPNARTIGVFDDDLCGRVLDCKVALWQMRRDASFGLDHQQILFSYRGTSFCLPIPSFSLHRFRVITGLRSTYRTIKPKGAVSFTAMLADHDRQQEHQIKTL